MESFVKNLKNKERHLVTIIDPHLSTNDEYEIAQTLRDNSIYLLITSFNFRVSYYEEC